MYCEIFKSLLIITFFCFSQANCNYCLIKEQCGKMPCEW